jgi:acetyl-CoA carboxylase carboxyl transferase subunit alpha
LLLLQTQDIANEVFDNFMELFGDGKVGRDSCIRGGIASFEGMDNHPCVVIGTYKGHTPHDMQDTNYGMASPHGYRTALRLMQMAERFGLPVITLVDTVGAWPTFECERDGQSEAIATNLTAMSGLRVPIVTLLVGEGGSGGALGIGMGNSIGMLSGGYFGVISPEGAASILGRYKDDAHKAIQFPKDCQELAVAQCIYANQLKEIGVVDEIIWEHAADSTGGETYRSFPILKSRIRAFLISTLSVLMAMSPDQLVAQRYQKFRSMGMYDEILTSDDRSRAVRNAEELIGSSSGQKPRARQAKCGASKVIQHLAEETMSGTWSRYRKATPATVPTEAPAPPPRGADITAARSVVNAKSVLDSQGPAALALWVREQTRVRIMLSIQIHIHI